MKEAILNQEDNFKFDAEFRVRLPSALATRIAGNVVWTQGQP